MSWQCRCAQCGLSWGPDKLTDGVCPQCLGGAPSDAAMAKAPVVPSPVPGADLAALHAQLGRALAQADRAVALAENAAAGEAELRREAAGHEAALSAAQAEAAKAKRAATDWREKAEAARDDLHAAQLQAAEAAGLRVELAEAREALRLERARTAERERQLVAKIEALDAEGTRLRIELDRAQASRPSPAQAAAQEAARAQAAAQEAARVAAAKRVAAEAPRGVLARTGLPMVPPPKPVAPPARRAASAEPRTMKCRGCGDRFVAEFPDESRCDACAGAELGRALAPSLDAGAQP